MEEAKEEEEEEELILHLFDLYWFKHKILTNPKPSQKQTHNESDQEPTKPLSPIPLQVITPSIDHQPKYPISHTGVESPTSVLALSKETETFSDDDATKRNNKSKNHHQRRKRTSRFRKRATELEHEELKGFMELGFVFSEEAKESPWLVGILPGLQRIGAASIDGEDQEEERAHVYLSETWNKKKKKNNISSRMMMMVMMNWRLPSLSNEDDMKRHLRVWAHAVASVVT